MVNTETSIPDAGIIRLTDQDVNRYFGWTYVIRGVFTKHILFNHEVLHSALGVFAAIMGLGLSHFIVGVDQHLLKNLLCVVMIATGIIIGLSSLCVVFGEDWDTSTSTKINFIDKVVVLVFGCIIACTLTLGGFHMFSTSDYNCGIISVLGSFGALISWCCLCGLGSTFIYTIFSKSYNTYRPQSVTIAAILPSKVNHFVAQHIDHRKIYVFQETFLIPENLKQTIASTIKPDPSKWSEFGIYRLGRGLRPNRVVYIKSVDGKRYLIGTYIHREPTVDRDSGATHEGKDNSDLRDRLTEKDMVKLMREMERKNKTLDG